jgi:hypothetical protein
LAGHFGAFIWRVILAHLFGGFSQAMKSKLLSNEEKERKCTISESVDCIMPLYIASNIVLFAFVAGSTEPANCGLATVAIVDLWILPRMKYTS